jgi:hypothetical protein
MTAATSPPTREELNESREAVAVRLLKSSAERSYDPDVDVDWDSDPVEGKLYHPEELISLYGTPLWDAMTSRQRYDLGRYEIAWIAARGVFAEIGLMQCLLRVASAHGPTSAHSHYALTEIADECRHSIMFGRAIKAGLGDEADRLPRLPKAALAFARIAVAVVPFGPAIWASTLMIEDLLDRMQREVARDDRVQPVVRMVNRIHILEEARHMAYARGELFRSIREAGRPALAFNRFVIALAAYAEPRVAIHPKVYAMAGLNPRAARRQALSNPHYRDVLRRHAAHFVSTLEQAGLLKGRFTMALWRRSLLLESGR